MEVFLLIGIAVAWYVVATSDRDNAAPAKAEQPVTHASPWPPVTKTADAAFRAAGRKRFVTPIPRDCQIYESRMSVAGTRFRSDEALRFANGTGQSLRFEAEATNAHDPHAIKVIGVTDTGEHHLGYLWRELAERIAQAGLVDQLKPRLTAIYWQGSYVDVEFQVVGPRSEMARFYDDSRHEAADAAAV